MRATIALLFLAALFFVIGVYFIMTNYLLSGGFNIILSVFSLVVSGSRNLQKNRLIVIGLAILLLMSSTFVLANLLMQ